MRVERLTGPVAEALARPLPDPLNEPLIWTFAPRRPTLVLGSAQPDTTVDASAAAGAGADVVRRRSGGGAVFLVPGRCLWLDVLLPRGDARWLEDVARSSHWLGETWAQALRDLGVTEVNVMRGRLQNTEWGRLVCFGALGPGEVTVFGRKVVGIAQRRTRVAARLQCLVLDGWDPREVLDLLALSDADRQRARRDLADVASGAGVSLIRLEAAFLDRMGSGVKH